MARLVSLNVGLPREVTWNGKTVRTAIWKFAVVGRRMVRKPNIEGDGQADLAGHGGEQRAVFVYQMDSYHYWERFLGRNDFSFGQFGENFTVKGLADNQLAAKKSEREGWWIYGARDSANHPFAEESRSLLGQISGARSYIVYSRPAATDKLGVNFDAFGAH